MIRRLILKWLGLEIVPKIDDIKKELEEIQAKLDEYSYWEIYEKVDRSIKEKISQAEFVEDVVKRLNSVQIKASAGE